MKSLGMKFMYVFQAFEHQEIALWTSSIWKGQFKKYLQILNVIIIIIIIILKIFTKHWA